LGEQAAGTLLTIAKDVKIQVEFNPAKVAGYRLIGYENRLLANKDFKDDRKDAGEIGAGHSVTALYEIVPAGQTIENDGIELKYSKTEPSESNFGGELLTVKLRYKEPNANESNPRFVRRGKSN
jgi:Ca-activated chloride channel family protein